jgi:tetratricopeptide (TPR) repeat protein
MKNIFFYTIIFLILGLFSAKADDKKSLLREGNKLYKNKKYNEAEIKYRKAQEIDHSPKSTFNLGAALYKENNYEEATQKFKEIAGQKLDSKTLAKVNHNLGNSLFQSGNYEESVNAYKNALKLNPKDEDTRYNLELSKRLLKIQQEQQKNQQDQNQQNKDNKDNQQGDKQQSEQDKNQNNKDNKDQNQQNKDNKQDNKQQDDKQNQNQGKESEKLTDKNNQEPNKPRPQEISKENAERILNALQKDEKDLQKKLRKQKGERAKIERNW